MKKVHSLRFVLFIALGVSIGSMRLAIAQAPKMVPPDEAALIVEGVVREVYRSKRENQTDYLVEVAVRKSEARNIAAGVGRLHFPAPGDLLTIYVWQRFAPTGRLGQVQNPLPPPAERAQIKAFLTPRDHGGWQATFPKWYELTSDQSAATAPGDPAPSEAAADDESDSARLGMTLEPIQEGKKSGLRVASIERGGPAQQAGLEVGDVLVAAGDDSSPLTSAEQLAALATGNRSLSLVVVDVNTGRAARIVLQTVGVDAADDEKPSGENTTTASDEPRPAPAGRSLGIAAEPVTIGQRTALKVSRVQPDGPAAQAGIEVGDVLVKANGAPLTGPEQLAAAVRKSGDSLTLTVRDVRTGRDVAVEVKLGAAQPMPPLPADVDTSATNTAKGRIGAVTELAFYDNEAAVKVTEVERNSPAARAGLQVGSIIVQAGDKLILHPSDLIDAERAASGTLRLTIVAPGGNRKSSVDVRL